jgi:hypothetical protein
MAPHQQNHLAVSSILWQGYPELTDRTGGFPAINLIWEIDMGDPAISQPAIKT